tara:strand:+ start:116 stop:316 length:201 start_codon:yes stop_codon:yes gene_type:complete
MSCSATCNCEEKQIMAQSTYTGDYRFDTTPSANPTPNINDKNNDDKVNPPWWLIAAGVVVLVKVLK